MLAIVYYFKEWRPELLFSPEGKPTLILTDHKSLEYFMTIKQLNRRQARWAEFLSQFEFKIHYRPGAQNRKTDLLTHQPDDNEESRAKSDPHLQQTLLPLKRLSKEVRKNLAIQIIDTEKENLPTRITQTNADDEKFNKIKRELEKETGPNLIYSYILEDYSNKNGVLYYKNKLAVPKNEYIKLIRNIHEAKKVGHSGTDKTVFAVKKNYIFPRLRSVIKRFVRNCYECKKTKAKRDRPQRLLQPLPIPKRAWKDISVDFVVSLPQNSERDNAIMIIINRLTKERHYIACKAKDKGISAESTA